MLKRAPSSTKHTRKIEKKNRKKKEIQSAASPITFIKYSLNHLPMYTHARIRPSLLHGYSG